MGERKRSTIQEREGVIYTDRLGEEVVQLRAENARLREALRFYAAKVSYEEEMGMRSASPIELDRGERARAVLHTDGESVPEVSPDDKT